MPLSTKIKKMDWLDRLPTPIQNAITYVIVGGAIVFIVVLLLIATGSTNASPPMNFIADYDGVSQTVLSYDPIPKEYIVSYRNCTGDFVATRLKAGLVVLTQKFHGNPCPTPTK